MLLLCLTTDMIPHLTQYEYFYHRFRIVCVWFLCLDVSFHKNGVPWHGIKGALRSSSWFSWHLLYFSQISQYIWIVELETNMTSSNPCRLTPDWCLSNKIPVDALSYLWLQYNVDQLPIKLSSFSGLRFDHQCTTRAPTSGQSHLSNSIMVSEQLSNWPIFH